MNPKQGFYSYIVPLVLCVASLTATVADEPATANETPTPEVPQTHPAQAEIAAALQAYKAGNGDLSLNRFIATAAKHKDLAPGEVMFAHLAFATNKVDIGRKALEMAAVSHPDDPEVWNMFADLAMRSGRLAEAQILFEKALAVSETFAANEDRGKKLIVNAHAGRALTFERRAQWKQAEAELRTWIELDKKNAAAWQRLAAVAFASEQYDLARQTLDNLKSFDESQPAAEITMGMMYQRSGQLEKAAASMKSAIEKDGDRFATRIAAAQWALIAGDKQTLSACVQKAAELEPESVAVKILQAMAHRFDGKPAEAEAVFRSLLAKNPASFDTSNGLALSLLEQDDAEKHRQAVQYAQVLAQSNSDLRTARGRGAASTFGWALHKTGRTAEAARVMQSVVQSGEISPEVGYFAAVIFDAQGNSKLALELLKAALSSSVAFAQQDNARSLMLKLQK